MNNFAPHGVCSAVSIKQLIWETIVVAVIGASASRNVWGILNE